MKAVAVQTITPAVRQYLAVFGHFAMTHYEVCQRLYGVRDMNDAGADAALRQAKMNVRRMAAAGILAQVGTRRVYTGLRLRTMPVWQVDLAVLARLEEADKLRAERAEALRLERLQRETTARKRKQALRPKDMHLCHDLSTMDMLLRTTRGPDTWPAEHTLRRVDDSSYAAADELQEEDDGL